MAIILLEQSILSVRYQTCLAGDTGLPYSSRIWWLFWCIGHKQGLPPTTNYSSHTSKSSIPSSFLPFSNIIPHLILYSSLQQQWQQPWCISPMPMPIFLYILHICTCNWHADWLLSFLHCDIEAKTESSKDTFNTKHSIFLPKAPIALTSNTSCCCSRHWSCWCSSS